MRIEYLGDWYNFFCFILFMGFINGVEQEDVTNLSRRYNCNKDRYMSMGFVDRDDCNENNQWRMYLGFEYQNT